MPLPGLSSITGALSDLGEAAASTPVGKVLSGEDSGAVGSVLGDKVTRGVVILLGLLLVAAGLFTFQKTREIVVEAGRTAGAVAAAA